MEKEEFIQHQINFLKVQAAINPDDIKMPDHMYQWLEGILDSAWERGDSRGTKKAYEDMMAWKNREV